MQEKDPLGSRSATTEGDNKNRGSNSVNEDCLWYLALNQHTVVPYRLMEGITSQSHSIISLCRDNLVQEKTTNGINCSLPFLIMMAGTKVTLGLYICEIRVSI